MEHDNLSTRATVSKKIVLIFRIHQRNIFHEIIDIFIIECIQWVLTKRMEDTENIVSNLI
jgi:hypothetical protein